MKLNNKGEAVFVLLAIGMIWGTLATIAVHQVVEKHKAPVVAVTE